jgi:hypothetical protein
MLPSRSKPRFATGRKGSTSGIAEARVAERTVLVIRAQEIAGEKPPHGLLCAMEPLSNEALIDRPRRTRHAAATRL